MPEQLKQILLVLACVLLSAGAALGLRSWLHPPFHLQAAQLLPEPIALQGQGYRFTFMGDKPVYLDQAMEHWVLIYVGSRSCTACQADLQALGQMMQQFDGVDAQYKPKVLFISLDPENDSADKLETYTKFFNKDLVGITGHRDELARFTQVLGVSAEEYLAKRSARIFILDPQLRYIGSFAAPCQSDVLYSDMQQLIHQLWRYHLRESHSHKVISAP